MTCGHGRHRRRQGSSLVTIAGRVALSHLSGGRRPRAALSGKLCDVRISGHILGGGHGLRRAARLTANSIEASHHGRQPGRVSSQCDIEVDIDWACKGGGGGSFASRRNSSCGCFR